MPGCRANKARARSRALAGIFFVVSATAACSVREPHEKTEQANGASSRELAPAGLMTWRPNTRSTYDLSLKSRIGFGAVSDLSDVELSGRLFVTRPPETKTAASSLVSLHVRLPEAGIASEHGVSAADRSALAAELSAGFVVDLERGRVRSVRMAPSASAFAANLARTIAAELELPAPSGGAPERWEERQSDATGTYRAEYRAVTPEGRYRRRKLGYDSHTLTSPGASSVKLTLTPEIVASEATVELERGELRSLDSSEKLKTGLAGQEQATVETRLTLKRVAIEPAASSGADLLSVASLRELGPAVPSARKQGGQALDAAKIGSFTLESALSTLERLVGDTEEPLLSAGQNEAPEARALREKRVAEHNRAFSALVAILRSDPAALERAAGLVQKRPESAKLLLDAIASVDTPEAQDRLVALAQARELDVEFRRKVALSVVRIQTPTARTVEALMRWLDDETLRIHATYGLGSMARLVRGRDPELATRAGRALIERLGRASAAVERVHALRGIANSGDSAAFPAVRALLTDENDSVRGAAVEALRLMDHPDVDATIAARLTRERSNQALRAVLNAAKLRTPSPLLAEALSTVALSSKDSQSRYRAVQLMASWLDEEPSLKTALLEIAKRDESDAVRRAAQDAVHSS
ncbi:MAG TPA: HEAT repeat domain-containing protein [Polyangiaceae bacterium]